MLRFLCSVVLLVLAAGCTTPGTSFLREAGVFYVGGSVTGDPPQHVGQARVHSFVGEEADGPPIVLYPGLGLSSVIWLTTPDGREGWAQQMARAGHPTYAYEPVNTGPSGFPVGSFRGEPTPSVSIWDIDQVWRRWGFGEAPGEPWPDVRYPVEHIEQFYASWPPRVAAGGGGRGRGGGDGDSAALEALLERVGPAVVVPHSMAGRTVFALAARRPELFEALVVVEPLGCPGTADAVEPLLEIPFLAVYGDYIESRGQTGRFEACRETARLLDEAGGTGAFVYLPEEGVRGNTHLLMQDDNSAAIADRILQWLDEVTG